MKIISPALLVDEFKVKANILEMVEKAQRNEVIFRPHFKTHQSHEIGRWFRELGVEKITVSSLLMAEYFAEDNWSDITVAFPVNILEIETINRLAEKIRLNLLVESLETVRFLSANLRSEVNLFIKIDTGYGRTGIKAEDEEQIIEVIDEISNSANTNFSGFLTHAGNSYDARTIREIEMVHLESTGKLSNLRNKLRSTYPGLIISVGDTPTCSVVDDFSMVDEIRPGNFVFFDTMQHQIGACSLSQIAVAMACPVVALHPERNEIVIHGGSVHFSTEYLEENGIRNYGTVVETEGNHWEKPIEGTYLKKLSQEHGIIKTTADMINKVNIGDILMVLPVHSCTTANQMKAYLNISNGEIISRI